MILFVQAEFEAFFSSAQFSFLLEVTAIEDVPRDVPTSEGCFYVSSVAFRLQLYVLSFGSIRQVK